MEVEYHLFVVENGLPFGAILHFHVSFQGVFIVYRLRF